MQDWVKCDLGYNNPGLAMTDGSAMKRTPLNERHKELGAKMVEFGGWEMPVQYTGIIDEHTATRTAAGLFDISHMGQINVGGPDALPFLQSIATQDVATIDEGMSNYSLMCYPDGGIVDDIFIYHLPDRYLVVVNASNVDKDFAWLHEHVGDFAVEIENISDQTTMLALQGPRAEAILARVADVDASAIPFHGVMTGTLLGHVPAIIARTGYTGEDGFELFFANEYAGSVWNGLLEEGHDDGLKPIGLGARDSLRFEPKLALYGHEISETVNPYEAGLGWVVKLDKGPFLGREALQRVKAEGPRRKLVGLEMIGRGIARGGYRVATPDGDDVGEVTSGMPAPTLGKNLALALVRADVARAGTELDVVIRGKPVRARVVKTPFYQSRYKK
ncbi:MAG: Aminomethyltransferase (glycine cleavage system T protein) [uncultured Chloroflexia bacterium]|uniref:Aminomethyltransferase n=1 Tax=uncultured Chloroflexia bacterium TaxID=1672391 RepID=A0A6J4JHJ1_9CHLR|nr:MAG: Aminomethyltransferase (glycine cleavage system T protein) [uncultured Chloroflexia bacterium]